MNCFHTIGLVLGLNRNGNVGNLTYGYQTFDAVINNRVFAGRKFYNVATTS